MQCVIYRVVECLLNNDGVQLVFRGNCMGCIDSRVIACNSSNKNQLSTSKNKNKNTCPK